MAETCSKIKNILTKPKQFFKEQVNSENSFKKPFLYYAKIVSLTYWIPILLFFLIFGQIFGPVLGQALNEGLALLGFLGNYFAINIVIIYIIIIISQPILGTIWSLSGSTFSYLLKLENSFTTSFTHHYQIFTYALTPFYLLYFLFGSNNSVAYILILGWCFVLLIIGYKYLFSFGYLLAGLFAIFNSLIWSLSLYLIFLLIVTV